MKNTVVKNILTEIYTDEQFVIINELNINSDQFVKDTLKEFERRAFIIRTQERKMHKEIKHHIKKWYEHFDQTVDDHRRINGLQTGFLQYFSIWCDHQLTMVDVEKLNTTINLLAPFMRPEHQALIARHTIEQK